MGRREITVLTGIVREQAAYVCLLTAEPCGLVPIRLRRMILLPGFWVGWHAVVMLPLARSYNLVGWQYLRMLRPYAVFFGFLTMVLAMSFVVEPEPGSPLAIALVSAILLGSILLWVLPGRLLQRHEFVRLVDSSRRRGTVTLRFSTPELAERASEVLVFPEDMPPAPLKPGERRPPSFARRLGAAIGKIFRFVPGGR